MDDFERKLRETLDDRVANAPAPADASPVLLSRARRRRAAKLTALGVTVVIVAGGTVGAIAQVAGDSGPKRVITSTHGTGPRPSVPTAFCSLDQVGNTPGTRVLPPSRPRIPPAGDPEVLSTLTSFAASDLPQYIVLGPRGWACHQPLGPRDTVIVYDPTVVNESTATADDAPIVVENAVLWAPLAVSTACSVFDDPEVMQVAHQANVSCLSERSPRRTVTRVDEHVATFVDANGDRGVGWLQLPSSKNATDGSVSVLTCRPDKGLSVAICDTIIADYSARLASAATAPTVQCPSLSEGTERRVPTSAVDAQSALQYFSGGSDPRYDVLGPDAWSCLQRLTDSGSSMVVYDPNATPGQVPPVDSAPIAIENEVWSDASGARLLCSVFDDSSVVAFTNQSYPGSCKTRDPARRVTRVSGDAATFVDANGDRGAGWMLLPSPNTQEPGRISVLTCRPSARLTVATCDAIVTDYVARLTDGSPPPSTTTSTTTTTPSASVGTTACPLSYGVVGSSVPPPSTVPRVPRAGDPALFSHLLSFAATDDPRMVALGPSGWTCQGLIATDGDNALVVYQTAAPGGAAPDIFAAPIAIESDWLWHGGVGSVLACRATGDPAAVQYVTQYFPQELPCPSAGRTVTGIDAHTWSFVDADGARGGVWMALPSSPNGDDGKIGVLTCRPTTDLTAAECDTIIADWLARNDTTG